MILKRKKTRRGFTLIELLVAMSLTVFVMTILSDAFTKGLTTFSQLKSIGDMQESLRVATSNLRSDLSQDHFNAKRRASDPTLWTDPPRDGFVVLYQAGGSQSEGTADGIPSLRATTHVLHLAVKRRGNKVDNFFAAPVPAGSPLLTGRTDLYGAPADATLRDANFKSQWAEVAYFLVRTGTTVDNADATTTVGVIPVYNLYRLELTVVPEPTAVNAAAIPASTAGYNGICCYDDGTGKFYFPGPSDLVTPAKRMFKPSLVVPGTAGYNAAAVNNYVARASLVMSDVISFDVQMVPAFPDLVPETPFVFGDVEGGLFDSGSGPYQQTININTGQKLPATLKGISITIRGWDRGNAQGRQVTMIVDM